MTYVLGREVPGNCNHGVIMYRYGECTPIKVESPFAASPKTKLFK